MKLWPTITENKCFVKMLWHLLGECVKAIVLLVCSICTVHHYLFLLFFFSIINLCSFFLYIKRANRLMNSVMNNIFDLVTCLFSPFFFFKFTNLVWASSFFFKGSLYVYFFTCNVSLHCIHTKVANIIHIWKKKIVQIL